MSEEFYADVEAWEAAHGHDVRLKCYPEFQCQVIESYLEWLVARLADALEAAEAERDAALAVIEKAREAVKSGSRMDANPTRLGGPPECMEGDRWWQSWHLQADAAWRKNMTEALSSVPADVLRERVAEKWDEGAKWAAVELGAIDNERQAWITPTDNPYRQTGEETDV